MRKVAIVTLILLNIAFSSAVFLKKPSKTTFTVFNQLKNVESFDFGKKLLDTVALQLKNKSPLGDIAKLLAEIRQDLVIQQQEADALQAAREVECEEEIAEYNRRISVATGIISDAESEIAILKSEIDQLEGEIANKQAQLEILTKRESDLRAARERDAAAFEKRQAQGAQVLEALDLIVERLETIPPEGSAEAALAELSKIGSSNPILALVQVASTFSAESLNNVIEKMNALKESVAASLEQDKVDEAAAIQETKALQAEIEKTRTAVQQALADAQAKLKQAQGALALQEKILEEATAELKQANEDKAAKIQQCDEWRAKHAEEKEKRTAEVDVIKQVENIIATKLDTMKDYLKERANAEE